ncbi:hypothetical protein ACRAWD_22120 [Caulobacter segnis]
MKEPAPAIEVEGCGLIVSPGDGAAMAAAIVRLAADERLRRELAQAARERAEQRWRRSAVIDGLEVELKRPTVQSGRSVVQPQAS